MLQSSGEQDKNSDYKVKSKILQVGQTSARHASKFELFWCLEKESWTPCKTEWLDLVKHVFVPFSIAKKCLHYFVELCILVKTSNREIMQNFTFMEINNLKISNISIRKNWRVRVTLWTCSHFDSVICKVFMCKEQNLWIWNTIFYIPKQFGHIFSFLQFSTTHNPI